MVPVCWQVAVASTAPVAAGAVAIMGMAIRVAMTAAIAPVRRWRGFVGTCPVLPSTTDRTRSLGRSGSAPRVKHEPIALDRSSPRRRVDTHDFPYLGWQAL